MGPKAKRKMALSQKIAQEKKLEKERALARERQKLKRANLIKKHIDEDEMSERENYSPEPSHFVEVKEEPCSTDEDPMEEEPKSELLPGTKGQMLYYDGVGYYYTQIYDDVKCRWLQCYHGDCKVMAQMRKQDGAPIRLVDKLAEHDHPPNPSRRDCLLFLHTIKARHTKEDTPFATIYQEEALENPVGASYFSLEKIQAHLQKKISSGGSENLSQESVRSATSQLSKMSRDKSCSEDEPVTKKMKTDQSPRPEKKISTAVQQQTFNDSNTDSDEPAPKRSTRIPGNKPNEYLYLDGNGGIFKSRFQSKNVRFLRCNSTGCPARAVMQLEPSNAPIFLEPTSPRHNHIIRFRSKKVSSPPIKITDVHSQATENRPRGVIRKALTNKGVSPAIHPIKLSPVGHQATGIDNSEEEGVNSNNIRIKPASVVLNKLSHDTPRFKKRYEKLEGPEYFYDYKGHYYFSTKRENNKRYLRCLIPTCPSQAMLFSDDAEIQPIRGSRPHNHKPDTTTNRHDKIRQWEDQWQVESLPSERLPSLRVQFCCYHDGRGFYYHQTSQKDNIRQLACVEPKCPVKACMNTLKDAPISVLNMSGHSHGPDFKLRDALLFVDAVRIRVRSGTSIATAISLEAARNPDGAERVILAKLKNCLEDVEKLKENKRLGIDIGEDEVDFASCVDIDRRMGLQPSTETLIPVPNHFGSGSGAPLDQYTDEEGILNKSEMVPALFSDSWLFHDGCGFYYNTTSTSNGFRYLECVTPKCGVRAVVAEGGGPVKCKQSHSHGPQPPQHRRELWFFHRIKVQAQKNPGTSLLQIYKEVAKRDPEGAVVVPQAEILKLVHKFLISVVKNKPIETTPKNRSGVSIPSTVEILPTSSGDILYHDGRGR